MTVQYPADTVEIKQTAPTEELKYSYDDVKELLEGYYQASLHLSDMRSTEIAEQRFARELVTALNFPAFAGENNPAVAMLQEIAEETGWSKENIYTIAQEFAEELPAHQRLLTGAANRYVNEDRGNGREFS